MKRTAGLKYKNYITLGKEQITNINHLVQKYCECVEFEAETRDGSKIEFESFDELIGYSNYGEDKIKHLTVYGRNHYNSSSNNRIHITFGPAPLSNEYSVSCSYSFESNDDETIFKKKLLSTLQRCDENQKIYIAGWWLFFALSIILEIKMIVSILVESYQDRVLGFGIVCVLFLLGGALGLSALFNWLWKKAFSPVVFAWGEELHHEEKMSKLRSNIIWTIIITAILNIVLSFFI